MNCRLTATGRSVFCIEKFFAEIPETATQQETLLLASSADTKPLACGKPHTPSRREAGRRGLGEGASRRPKGATECGCSVAPLFPLRNMGHARPRPKRLAEKLLQIREALGLSQQRYGKAAWSRKVLQHYRSV